MANPDLTSIGVTVLTTSFPLQHDSVSGLFVAQMIKHLPSSIRTTVLAPCGCRPIDPPNFGENHQIRCFRYAPQKWQILAHQPGGVIAAVKSKPWLLALVPALIISMLLASIRVSRKKQIIHANWSVNGALAGVAGKVLRIPVITTLRGTDVNKIPESRSLLRAAAVCMSLNARVVCVSEPIMAKMAGLFPQHKHKLTVISNGVDAALLNSPSPRDPLPHEKIRIITVGHLTRIKRVDLILRAIQRVGPEKTELSIVGDGPERPELERLVAELGIGQQVNFAGALPQPEVFASLSESDVFVLASSHEGKPNAVLEAMAAGLPVLASRIDGVRALVTEGTNGVLFEPGDKQDLCRQLQTLIRSPELRKSLGLAARQYVIKNDLSWHNTATRYVELYRSVLHEHGGDSAL